MRKTILNLFPSGSIRASAPEPELPAPPEPAEMPRVPVRFRLVLFGLLSFVVAGASIWFLSNPAGKVRDPRLGEKFNDVPLTSIGAAADSGSELWIGSMGKGLRVYRTRSHHFGPDITVASTGGRMLSDYVVDIDASEIGEAGGPTLGAVVAAAGPQGGATGLQAFAAALGSPEFWPKPLVDLKVFPGLSDRTASSVGVTIDGGRLVVGTRGHGVGVYTIEDRSWSRILTEEDGLPSNTVHDLAVVSPPLDSEPSWLYVATDKGVAAGHVHPDGSFEPQRVLDSGSGLAGDDVRELEAAEGRIWYRTAGQGFGRFGISPSGAPDGTPPEVLVTESRMPGLEDGMLRGAARSPAGPVTWFVAGIGEETHVGRYREFPRDLSGIDTPENFKPHGGPVPAATDWETGAMALYGTESGAWCFIDEGLSGVAAAFAGPEGASVHGCVFARRLPEPSGGRPSAFIKASAFDGPPSLLRATSMPTGPWDWATVVGPGRFPGLESIEEISCFAAEGERLYFGTTGKGIGVWSRSTAEILRHGHSSGDAPMTLRDDRALDLAVSRGTLVQVTGDFAVDAFPGAGGPALPLVPPSSAGLRPENLRLAAASGPWIALAEAGRLSAYDSRTFRWRDLHPDEDLVQIEMVGSGLWTRSGSGLLHFAELDDPSSEWREIPGRYLALGVNRDTVAALADSSGGAPGGIVLFDGETAAVSKEILPVPAEPGSGAWRFAAATDDSLCLADEGGIHEYELETRGWSFHPYPAELEAPVTWARQNDIGFWLLDRSGRCAYFSPGNGSYRLASEGVENVAVSDELVLAMREDSPDRDRATVLMGPVGEQTAVGRAFGGDLGSVRDAIEWEGKLLALTPGSVGIRSWERHDWETFDQAAVSDLRSLIAAGGRLWATSGPGPRRLAAWTGVEFQPVLDIDDRPTSFIRASEGDTSVFQLAPDGKIFETAAAAPAVAEVVFSAPRLPSVGGLAPSRVAVIGDTLAAATGSSLHFYERNHEGLMGWRTLEGDGPVLRLVQSRDESLLLEERDNGFWIRSASGGSHERIELPSSPPAEAQQAAVAPGFVAVSFRVSGEPGLRVRLASPSAERISDLVGDPLPDGGRTLRVFETAAPAGVLRLSERGQVAWYDAQVRGWSVAIGEGGIREVQPATGQGFWAWDERNRTLLKLDGKGSPTGQEVSDSRLSNVSFFRDGALLHYSDGKLERLDLGSGETEPVVEARGAGPGANLSSIAAAGEVPGADLLVLQGGDGRIVAYDWAAQRWLGSRALPSIDAMRTEGGRLYFIDRSQRILGPVGAEEGELSAPAPEREVRQYLPLDRGFFAIGTDGSLQRFETGWEDASGGETPFEAIGTVTEIFDAGGLEFFFDGQGRGTARSGASWLSWDGQGTPHRLESGLFLLVDGVLSGPLEPDPEAPERIRALPVEHPDGLQFSRVHGAGGKLYLRAEDETWHDFDGDGFNIVEGEPPEAEEREGIPGIERFGEEPRTVGWRPSELDSGVFERRFGDRWIPVRFDAGGFDFEDTLASEIRGPEVWVYTPAGRLVFAGDVAPRDLDPATGLPDGLAGIPRFDLHEGTPVLIGETAQWIWEDGSGWSPVPDDWVEAFEGRPLLRSATWEWSSVEQGDRVSLTSLGKKRSGIFSARRGRFPWDDVKAVGQAGGRIFALTEAGLFPVHESGMGAEADLGADETGGVEGLEFVESTGAEPGGLRRGDEIVQVFDGTNWRSASEATEALRRIESVRIGNGSWLVARDGGISRALPQEPDRFAPVAVLEDGRWDFETVEDLVAVGRRCFLATKGGLVALEGMRAAAWWPEADEGRIEGIRRVGESVVAQRDDGTRLRFDGSGWVPDEGGEDESLVVREGRRFRVSRSLSGELTFEVRRHPSGEFAATEPFGGRFGFERFDRLSVRDGGVILAATPEGLVEIDRQGDIRQVSLPVAGADLANAAFFAAPHSETGKWETYLEGAGTSFVYRDGWRRLDPEDSAAAAERARGLLVLNRRWVVRQSDVGLSYRLRLDADPPGAPKPVDFDAGERLFDFDRFLSVALADDVGQALVIGTAAGAQRVPHGAGVVPDRLWRQGQRQGRSNDGLDASPVSEIVRCANGTLYARQGGVAFELHDVDGRFAPAAEERRQDDIAVRASDEQGWTVVAGRSSPFDLKWKGQPVRMKGESNGTSRFAHNLVHSTAVSAGRLVFGTEGGMMFLDAPEAESLTRFELVSAPFLQGSEPEPVVWIFPENEGATLRATDRSGREWTVEAPLSEGVKSSPPMSAEDLANAAPVHRDDILQWREESAGRVSVSFRDGLAHPEDLRPEIEGGTFTFLRLAGADGDGHIAAAAPGVLWATEAGIVHYDPDTGAFLKLSGATADGSVALGGGARFVHRQEDDRLFVRIGGFEGQLDDGSGLWAGIDSGTGIPSADPDLIGRSSLLEWRRGPEGRATAALLEADSEPGRFIGDQGKALIDEIRSFALVRTGSGAGVLTGTGAGAVRHEEDSFAYLGTSYEAFNEPVSEIATVAALSGRGAETVARSESGNPFRWFEERGWAREEEETVAGIFAESYRVHRDERWDWAQYPQGIACTLMNTNGPPLPLGESAIPGLPPVFSGERLAIDHVQSVAVSPAGEILAGTPLGILRFAVDPQRMTVTDEAIDVWAGEGEARERIPFLDRVKSDSREVIAWNDTSVFKASASDRRLWLPLPAGRVGASDGAVPVLETFSLHAEGNRWRFRVVASDGNGGRRMTVSHNEARPWPLPFDEIEPRDIVATGSGAWVLNGNELYLLRRRRLLTHPLQWLGR